jgi:UDP-N-acetylmuramate: L-alanyl-gamma-D-glutamyl-meso-diaminopimelate ligase
VIIGNALSRGNPMVEYVLERNIPYISGPQWLLENVLKDRWVIALSGTHGKTTTSSMVAWILEYAHLTPGYLIGGVPQNFSRSARLGNAPFFVIEADEYDSAFFDKRSKFVHYRPRTLVINNMEFDHGDIFNDITDIQRQFHHLVRMVPSNGLILAPKNDPYIDETLAMGCWTTTHFSLGVSCDTTGWSAEKRNDQGSEFIVYFNGEQQGIVRWQLIGDFNIENALMAIAAARHAGVPSHVAIEALAEFINTKRRLELRGTVNNIAVYDDFAHHPTAIQTTLDGLRKQVETEKIIAIVEPRSNTMRMGVHTQSLADSLNLADKAIIYQPENLDWDLSELIKYADNIEICTTLDGIMDKLKREASENSHFVLMSNGSFGGIYQRLIDEL